MITKDLSRTISNAAIRAAKAADHSKLFKRLIDTSTALYIAAFGKDNMDLMNSLPTGWFERHADFSAYFGGQRRTLYFSSTWSNSIDPFTNIQYGALMRMPASKISSSMEAAPAELKEAFAEAYDDYFYFRAEIIKLREKTEATIRGFRNLNVLAEQWPEIAPYIPAGQPVTKASTALFNPASLNAAIGLPPK